MAATASIAATATGDALFAWAGVSTEVRALLSAEFAGSPLELIEAAAQKSEGLRLLRRHFFKRYR